MNQSRRAAAGLVVLVGLLLISNRPLPAAAAIDAGMVYSPSAIQRIARPGEDLPGVIHLRNQSAAQEELSVSLADLSLADDGTYLTHSIGAANPLRLGTTLLVDQMHPVLDPNSEVDLRYTVRLPADLPNQDIFAALMFTVRPTGFPDHSFGIPLMFRVTRDPAVTTIPVRFDPTTPPLISSSFTDYATQISQTSPYAKLVEVATSHLYLSPVSGSVHYVNRNQSGAAAEAQLNLLDGWTGQPVEALAVALPAAPTAKIQTAAFRSQSLWRDTRVGRLPYLGPVTIRAHIPGQLGTLTSTGWVIPWWAFGLLLLATAGIVSRLVALHPHVPHRPLRYQGRLSLAVLLLLLGMATVPTVSIADETASVTVTARVPVYVGYTIERDDAELVVDYESNYYLQLTTESVTRWVGNDDPPVRIPVDESFQLMGTFGSLAE